MDKPYEISEKDIESTMRWLQVNDPENASRESAMSLLRDMRAGFHQMSHNNPELLLQLKQELEGTEHADQEKSPPVQKYVLVKFLEQIPEGTEFSAASWPLHITLASNFIIDWEETNLFEKLATLLSARRPIATAAGDDDYFGPRKQVHVTKLEMTPDLQSLHNDVIALLKGAGAAFDEPQYQEEGYQAHATVQQKRLHKGDPVLIDELTIVDMLPHSDISKRKTMQTLKLGS